MTDPTNPKLEPAEYIHPYAIVGRGRRCWLPPSSALMSYDFRWSEWQSMVLAGKRWHDVPDHITTFPEYLEWREGQIFGSISSRKRESFIIGLICCGIPAAVMLVCYLCGGFK